MAKISALPDGSAVLSGDDLFPFVDVSTGRNRGATLESLSSYAPVYNLLNFRSDPRVDIGDGVNDATTVFQDALDGTPDNSLLYIPKPTSYYNLTDTLTLDHPLILRGDRSRIQQATSGKGGISVTSRDVEVFGVEFGGPQFASYNATEVALKFTGTAGVPLVGIKTRFCKFYSWGRSGIETYNIERYAFEQNEVFNIVYAGIFPLSSQRGSICLNYVDGIVGDIVGIGSVNCYGIVLSRRETDSLAVGPLSTDTIVANNAIYNIPLWHALDCHGGKRHKFVNNVIRNCYTGVNIQYGQDTDNVTPKYAPIDCVARGNDMDSTVTDGSAGPGIVLIGAYTIGSVGSPYELSTGNHITGNTLRGYGNDTTGANGGALHMTATRGALIADNTIIEPNPNGILMNFDNYDFYCKDNLIVDVWNTGAIGDAEAIVGANNDANFGRIEGNQLQVGTKAATKLNNIGLRIDAGSLLVHERGNDFTNAATPYSVSANDTVNDDAVTVDGWAVDNVSGTVGDTELQRNGLTGGAGRFRPPKAGSVVGIIISATEAWTAGTLTVTPFKNTGLAGAAGSQLGSSVNTLSTSFHSERYIPVGRGEQTFAKFDEVYVTYSTSGWTPTTSDLRVALLVVYD